MTRSEKTSAELKTCFVRNSARRSLRRMADAAPQKLKKTPQSRCGRSQPFHRESRWNANVFAVKVARADETSPSASLALRLIARGPEPFGFAQDKLCRRGDPL